MKQKVKSIKMLITACIFIGAAIGCSDDSKATAEDAKNLQGIREGTTKLDPKGTIPSSELNQKLPPP